MNVCIVIVFLAIQTIVCCSVQQTQFVELFCVVESGTQCLPSRLCHTVCSASNLACQPVEQQTSFGICCL